MVVDPESKAMWDELRRGGSCARPDTGNTCCLAILRAIAEGLNSCTIYDRCGRALYHVKVNYCPECGRRLR